MDFFRLHSGPLDFFVSSFSLIGLFLGVQIWPHSHLPITNIPEYPPWVQQCVHSIAYTSHISVQMSLTVAMMLGRNNETFLYEKGCYFPEKINCIVLPKNHGCCLYPSIMIRCINYIHHLYSWDKNYCINRIKKNNYTFP